MSRRTRALAGCIAVLLVTCDAPRAPHVEAQPPVAPPTTPVPATFDPGVVRLADDAPSVRMRAAIAAGDTPLAQRIGAETATDPLEQARLDYLAARVALAAGDIATARARWLGVATSGTPLAPWASTLAAELTVESDPPLAQQLAERCLALGASAPCAREAQLYRARARLAAGDRDRAIDDLRALFEAGADVGRVGLSLGAALAARGDVESREAAIRVLRRVEAKTAGTTASTQATEAIAAILPRLPRARRATLEEPSIDDLLLRAQTYYDGMQHEEAAATFERAARRLEGDARCDAQLMQARTLIRARERERAIAVLDGAIASCTEDDARANARYLAAKTLGQRGRHEESIHMFETLERDHPSSRLADDALFLAALRAREMGDIAAMKDRLALVPTRYPQGDMRGEARFALASQLRQERAFDQALEVLSASVADDPGEAAEDIHGRAAYWRARTLEDLGRRDDALDAYEELARERPLAYYAQRAIDRMRGLDASRAEATLSALRGPTIALELARHDVITGEGFARAIELLRVGELTFALRELGALGLLGEDADEETLLLVAALLHEADEHPEASRLVRRRLSSFMARAPIGRDSAIWRIAYPHAYPRVFEAAASEAGVPVAFLRAIAREESQFSPRAVSVAHAYGLVQLIRPTANRFGRELGLPSDPESLKTPEINVRIGARFMRFLFDRYGGHAALVPPAYNAGYGASDRWLRERGQLPLDEWVESIPYDETRRYTRRVLQTYGVYAWLDGGALPDLPGALPERE